MLEEENGVDSTVKVNDSENESNESKAFDVSKFLEADSSLNDGDEASNDSDTNGNISNNDESDDDSDFDDSTNSFTWDSISTDEQNEGESNEEAHEEQLSNEDSTESNNDLEQNAQTDDVDNQGNYYSELSKDLNLETNDPKEIQEAVKNLIKENEELKTSGINNKTSKRVESLKGFKSLDDEKLVAISLKADGLSDEEVERAIEDQRSRDTLDLEAKKIRKSLDREIEIEFRSIEQKELKEKEAAYENSKRVREELKSTMDSKEEMFGFKIAKDPTQYQKVREEHFKYVTEGKFADEISKDAESMIQVSWLWKNRNALMSQLKNTGFSSGRRDVLDKISNVIPENTSSSKNYSHNDKTFNANKFNQV